MPSDSVRPTLSIFVTDASASGHQVYCRSSTGEEGTARVETPAARVDLAELILARPPAEELIALGKSLFQTLLVRDVEAVYRSAFAAATARRRGTLNSPGADGARLRIELTIVPTDLAQQPWELLYDPVRERFLSADGEISLARNLVVHEPTRRLCQPSRLRVLGLFPKAPELHFEGERSALERLATTRRLDLRCLDEDVTLRAVHHAVGDLRPHVVHFSGHGTYGSRSGLSMDRGVGGRHEADAVNFALQLAHTGEPPAAAVLSACEGGAADSNAIRSVASALLRHGVLGIAAMQTVIPDRQAAIFCEGFYGSLTTCQRGDLEAAMSSARILMLGAGGFDPSFASPVLFLRGSEFELWPAASDPQPLEQSDAMMGLLVGPSLDHVRTVNADGAGSVGIVESVGSVDQLGGVRIRAGGDVHYVGPGSKHRPEDLRDTARKRLRQRTYDRAASDLRKLDDDDELTVEDRIHLSLAILGGRSPRKLTRREALEIERHLLTVIDESEDRFAALARLTLAALKHDFYRLNGLEERPPSSEALLAGVDVEAVELRDLENLLEHMSLGADNPAAHRVAAAANRREAQPPPLTQSHTRLNV